MAANVQGDDADSELVALSQTLNNSVSSLDSEPHILNNSLSNRQWSVFIKTASFRTTEPSKPLCIPGHDCLRPFGSYSNRAIRACGLPLSGYVNVLPSFF